VLGGAESGAHVSDRGHFRGTRGNVNAAPKRAMGPGARQWDVIISGKQFYFHRLVCAAWHGPPPPTPKHEVNHKDLDPSNNLPENLERLTGVENIRHSRDTITDHESHAGAQSKPVRGRKTGSEGVWTEFASANAAAR